MRRLCPVPGNARGDRASGESFARLCVVAQSADIDDNSALAGRARSAGPPVALAMPLTAASPIAMPPPSQPFTRADFERAERVLMGRGRWPKAEIWRVRVGNEDWVVKDFAARGFLARNLVGANFIRRDLRALQRLDGIKGVPSGAFAVDRYALAYRFVPGRPLATIDGPDQPPEIFHALEETLREVHRRGIVHLDIRNCRNVIVNDRFEPVLLDFEASLDTGGWLTRWRGWLERFDLAGVYKHWARARPDTLGPERREVLEQMNRWRKAWVFRGLWYYPRLVGKLPRLIAKRLRSRANAKGRP
jgi:hypothetical protein